MENQINGMISAAIDPNHLYYLKDNEIVYKVEDTLTSAVSFGYKTVFAYCLEYERGRV